MKKETASIIIKIKRKIHEFILRKKIKNKKVTIISQNCLGGVIYNTLGVPFLSPTINLFIEDEDFVKLVENPKYYFEKEPEPYIEKYIDPNDNDVIYPLIKVGDIIIHCRHYDSSTEAIDAWKKRSKRVNYNEIFIIATSWNLHDNLEYIKRIEKSKYNKVIFTYKKYNFPNCVYLKGDKWKIDKRGLVRPAIPNYSENGYTRNFEELFDFPYWMNTGIVKKEEVK